MNELSSSTINAIDVLIVGAGPIGLAASLWFCKKNYSVILIEQYTNVKTSTKRAFNERHQQVGLNPDSLNFIKNLDVTIWGEIKRKGCNDTDWINIPLYILQNIFFKEIRNYKNVTTLFDIRVESVYCTDSKENCRIVLVSNDILYGVSPKFIIIADGKHDDKGTANKFFNFSVASKVNLSTYGIVGMIERNVDNKKSSICLKNYSYNSYVSELIPDLGAMYVRLLGNMKERYIALGLGDYNNTEKFKTLNSNQIRSLLIEAYNRLRDKTMGELEIKETDFSDYSKTPISIVLDYRKETIKFFEGSSTIVSVEGDAARKTTFFSGSGLNTGYKALQKTFDFCHNNENCIFRKNNELSDGRSRENVNDFNYILIDQTLLKKDQECTHISLELLTKGINYIGYNNHLITSDNQLSDTDPVIYSISPNEGEIPWFIHINGDNLVSQGSKSSCVLEWDGTIYQTEKIIIYNNQMIGVKIPKNAKNLVSITIRRFDGKSAISPIKYKIIEITEKPEIINVHKKDGWLCIEGKNFKAPLFVTVKSTQIEEKIKAYCNSPTSLIFTPTSDLFGNISFIVDTPNGSSNEFKDFDSLQ